jgi:tetratricopeptide (TPR) repeat protein
MLVDEAEGLELVDEDAAAAEAQEQIALLLDEAASQRQSRQLADAVDTLRAATEIDPRNTDVRIALRDVLLDGGRTEEAVDEMLTIASLQLDALDGEGAASSLEDVLTYDPGNERALATLRELGYDVDAYIAAQEAQAAQAAQEAQDAQNVEDAENADQAQFLGPAEPPPVSSSSSYDEPLPSYDLEEIGPAETSDAYGGARELSYDSRDSLPEAYEPLPEPVHDTPANLHAVDDPFGDQPLPSFPVVAPESDAAFDLVQAGGGPAVQGHSRSSRHVDALDGDLPNEEPEGERTRSVSRAEIETNVANTRPTAELEEALEEAEFFASRGLYDDARAVLNEQLSRLPNNPLLRERMHELDMQEQAAAQTSGTRQLPQGSDDRSFDIAASLDALESLDESSQPAEGNALVDGQIDVEEVFAKFKEGVSKQISIDDGQSHYDLGLAYKEMGLIDDAIREFEVAARDYKRACICESMIGLIHMERGNSNDAIDAFLRGLHAQVRTAEQETVLSFELGQAYESKKMFKDAVQYYQRVARREPNYRDVQERLRRLGKNEPAPMRAAAGADDEFDRAFDEIIGSGKLP